MKLTETQVRWFRLRRSGLVNPFASPEEAASALVGVQAQILPAAGLAIWNRIGGLTYEQFDRLLHEKRSLVKLWGQRGTLHIYASAEWPLIHGALAGQHTWWERQGEEVSGGKGAYRATVARVARLLRKRRTLGRSDLRAAGLDLDEALFSSWGGIFASLVRGGHACHAGQSGNEGRFAHREYWLPDLDWNPPPSEEANVEIVRRHLRIYSPITAKDLLYWRGAKAADTHRWLRALNGQTAQIVVAGQPMLALQADLDMLDEKPPPRSEWPVKLLYRFDPLILGIKDKAWIVEPQHYKRVFRPAGHIEGILLVQGRAAGTWRYDRQDSGIAVHLTAFSPLARPVQTAVEKNAQGVAQFFGLPLRDLAIATDETRF